MLVLLEEPEVWTVGELDLRGGSGAAEVGSGIGSVMVENNFIT